MPDDRVPKGSRTIGLARPTKLGWWLIVAGALSLHSAYRRTFGVWTIIVAGYLFGVFAVSQTSPRYFAPVWAVLIPLLAVPLDVLARLICRRTMAPISKEPPNRRTAVTLARPVSSP